ncbi:MAG: ATP-binding protein [Leptolyngbyaceae cyanobacterium CRU_2_3]|nr:ATP-binding protein [Leptolyngbyaceae cyanobacterium CRU_2_3]
MAPPSPAFPPTDPRHSYHGRVIAVGGPPHSGKSVFLAELYRQLLQRQASGIFLQRACPDGEGMWSNEADPAIVQQIRKKFAFSAEFVTLTLQAIERLGQNPQLSLVLLDLGGKRTAENAEILRRSTHCILLSAQAEETANWQTFAAAEACPILAIFQSRLIKLPDQTLDLAARSAIQTNLPLPQGTLVNLSRDVGTACYAEAIAQFADWLMQG